MGNIGLGLSLLAVAATVLATGCSQSSPLVESGSQNTQNTSAPATVEQANTGKAGGSGNAIRTRGMVPGRAGRVFVFAALDAACGTLPPPELAVIRKPSKGDLSYRSGLKTKIAVSAGGTCKDAEASGTGVYYTAHEGASGTDSFSLTAKLASGETMTRDFDVSIAE